MNPHKLLNGATYSTPNPFDAMSLASRVGGRVFRYTLGDPFGRFEYAVAVKGESVLFNKHTIEPCDRLGRAVRYLDLH
jgi:hypothetical protein